MARIFDTIYDVLFAPTASLPRIAERKAVNQAVFVGTVSALIPIMAIFIGLKNTEVIHFANIIGIMLLFGFYLSWFVRAAVWSLTAEFFGGRGCALGLFSALGFSHIPVVFLVPLWVGGVFLPPPVKAVWLVLSACLIAFWIVYLEITAIKSAYGLSGAKAALVLAAPLLLIAFLVLLLVLVVGVTAMTMPHAVE